MFRSAAVRPLALTLVSLVLLLAWDAAGYDLPLSRMVGTPMGFPLRDDWILVQVMHEGAKALSWLMVGALVVGIRWPWGPLRRLPTRDRVQFAGSVLACVLAVSVVKHASATSCPWDLQVFGGVARYVSHWTWGVHDGGPGGCFPAGHASAALAYLSGYFAFRRSFPGLARAWLVGAMGAGLLLGVGQQLRGAHYMSHTLWTAWICWATAYSIDALARFSYGLSGQTNRPARI